MYLKLKQFGCISLLCLNDQATLLEYNTLKGVYQIRALFSAFSYGLKKDCYDVSIFKFKLFVILLAKHLHAVEFFLKTLNVTMLDYDR